MVRRLSLLIALLLLTGCTAFQRAPTPAPAPAQPVTVAPDPVKVRVDGAPAPALTAIHFSDLQHGWASGGGFTVITADGGETWQEGSRPGGQPAGAPQSSCEVAPGNLLSVTDAQILQSNHGGTTWTPVFQSPLGDGAIGGPAKIQCRGGAAWVMFYGGAGMSHGTYVVYRSVDGGGSWAPMLVSGWGTPEALNKLGKPAIDAYPGPFDAVDASTAFFLGFCGPCEGYGTSSITRTADGGRTWQHDNIDFVRQANALSFVDVRHGWITAGGRILATSDGGSTWRQQYPAGGPGPAQAVSMVDANTGYGLGAPGNAGALLATHDGGRTWSQLAELPLTDLRQPPAQPSLTLSFPDAQHGWAIPRDGHLLRTTDAGAHWEAAPVLEGMSPVSGVAFATPTAGCIQMTRTDGSPSLFGSTDGGATWKPADAAGGVVACAGRLAGQAWLSAPPPTAKGRWTVLGARSDGSAWVALQGSTDLWATRDSGKTWQQYSWPPDYGLFVQSMSDVGAGQAWAVTVDGRLLRSTTPADDVWQIQ